MALRPLNGLAPHPRDLATLSLNEILARCQDNPLYSQLCRNPMTWSYLLHHQYDLDYLGPNARTIYLLLAIAQGPLSNPERLLHLSPDFIELISHLPLERGVDAMFPERFIIQIPLTPEINLVVTAWADGHTEINLNRLQRSWYITMIVHSTPLPVTAIVEVVNNFVRIPTTQLAAHPEQLDDIMAPLARHLKLNQRSRQLDRHIFMNDQSQDSVWIHYDWDRLRRLAPPSAEPVSTEPAYMRFGRYARER
jgi:hypothetical protein